MRIAFFQIVKKIEKKKLLTILINNNNPCKDIDTLKLAKHIGLEDDWTIPTSILSVCHYVLLRYQMGKMSFTNIDNLEHHDFYIYIGPTYFDPMFLKNQHS